MDILKWNTSTQEWGIPSLGVDQLDGGFISPIFGEDVKVDDQNFGLVLTSATKTWRITINDSGTLVITDITLP